MAITAHQKQESQEYWLETLEFAKINMCDCLLNCVKQNLCVFWDFLGRDTDLKAKVIPALTRMP